MDTPSKEAIETVQKVWIQTWQEWWNHGNPDWRAGRPEDATKSMIESFLRAAYAIDFEAHQQAMQEAQDECEKYRLAATVMCSAHIGVPQNQCPVCKRDLLVDALTDCLKWIEGPRMECKSETQFDLIETARSALGNVSPSNQQSQAMQGLQDRVEELKADVNHNAGRVVQEQHRADRLETENSRLKESIQSVSSWRSMVQDQTQRADRLQEEVSRWDAKWHHERRSRLHYEEIAGLYGNQRDDLAQQLAEAQAEVDKWTRMAACAGFDKTGLLAVGEELQKRDQQLADQRSDIERLVEALKDCVKWIDGPRGECKAETQNDLITQANAALTAVEKLTHPQDQMLFDLDKAERIGEQLTRDSPVVNGPAEVEP